MGFFNETEEEKRYKELIKMIRNSNLDFESIDYFVNYLIEVRDKKRINDFYDFDFLERVIIELCSNTYESYEDLITTFNKVVNRVKTLLPDGEKTEDYESIKREVVNYYCDIEKNNLFSNELYSLFDNRLDYLQIMNIILNDENLIDNFDKIVDFATRIGKEIDDQGLLKREIISYLHLFGSILSDESDYLEKRITEARMRYGVYPGINEKSIANISREVEKAKSILVKLEVLEKKVDDYVAKVDAKTRSGISEIIDTINGGKREIAAYSSDTIKRLQKELSDSKQELLDELNKYLVSLEDEMRRNTDQVFNKILIDAKEKLEQIRLVASSLSGTTTRELLKIQEETQRSMDKLRTYVENNPQLQSSLKVATDSEEVMKALLEFSAKEKEAEEASSVVTEVVNQTQIVLPETDFLVPKFEMTPGLLDAFNREKAFSKRMKKVEARIKELEAQGYIIPDALKEALPWYMMGKKIVYFYGPTQSGKTTIVDILAKVVGSELLDGGKITEDYSITSYNDVRGIFDENALFYAFYYGKTVFYDEIDNGNPDNLIVLGTFYSKLVDKVDHPNKEVLAQFAKRRFVPVNANARIVAAGNTTGRGRNRQYTARSRLDESSHERFVPIYVGYSEGVESKIFAGYDAWYNFFKFFRDTCNEWARNSSMDEAEGNVTTGDASTIVECIKENSMNASSLLNGLLIQTKDEDYLAFLLNETKKAFQVESISDEKAVEINNALLKNVDFKSITEIFVYEIEKKLGKGKKLGKRK